MRINLRKAHAIQEQINELIQEDYDTETRHNILLHDNYEPVLDHACTNYFDELEGKRALILARKEIRASLAEANSEFGINALLAEMNMFDAEIALIDRSLNKRDIRQESNVMSKQVQRKEEDRQKEGMSYERNELVVGIIPKRKYDEYAKDIKRLKKQKQTCSDQLLTLNVNSTIELSKEVVTLMREHQLVD